MGPARSHCATLLDGPRARFQVCPKFIFKSDTFTSVAFASVVFSGFFELEVIFELFNEPM